MSFADLPTEIVLATFEHAARENVTRDRRWVVQLVLVSHAVYNAVRPLLYHTLIITDRNKEHFASSKPAVEILPFVRSISVFIDRPGSAHNDLRQYLSQWTPPSDAQAHFDVPWPIAYNILHRLQGSHSKPLCIITSMLVRYELLHEAILKAYATSMPTVIATQLQRTGGYVPDHGEWYIAPGSQSSSPRDWGRAVLDSLPALRHIMFRVIDIGYYDDYTETMKDYLLEVREMVRGVLEHRSHLEVTILFGGDYLRHEAEVSNFMKDLELRETLKIWFDQRTKSWDRVYEVDIEDGWSGRDTWYPL